MQVIFCGRVLLVITVAFFTFSDIVSRWYLTNVITAKTIIKLMLHGLKVISVIFVPENVYIIGNLKMFEERNIINTNQKVIKRSAKCVENSSTLKEIQISIVQENVKVFRLVVQDMEDIKVQGILMDISIFGLRKIMELHRYVRISIVEKRVKELSGHYFMAKITKESARTFGDFVSCVISPMIFPNKLSPK